MNHLVRHMISEMPLQFGMTFEERQVPLISDAVKVIDLGHEAVPVLPEHLDRLHGQNSLFQIRVKAPIKKPPIRQTQ